MPNVLLLIDTSGSMERCPTTRFRVPIAIRPILPTPFLEGPFKTRALPAWRRTPTAGECCVQALTGNMNPFYSCESSRSRHRPLQERVQDRRTRIPRMPTTSCPITVLSRAWPQDGNVCATGPYQLPGAGRGIRRWAVCAWLLTSRGRHGLPRRRARERAARPYMQTQYSANSSLGVPHPDQPACLYDQARRRPARCRPGLHSTFAHDVRQRSGSEYGVSNPTGYPLLGQRPDRRWTSVPRGVELHAISVQSRLHAQRRKSGRHWNPPQPALLRPSRSALVTGVLRPGKAEWFCSRTRTRRSSTSNEINDQIQKVLVASRPYGATPLEGMMDDARDYYWYKASGPKDDHVRRNPTAAISTSSCSPTARRTSIFGRTARGQAGCPYSSKAAATALDLFNSTSCASCKKVTTFVIGFSVNGSGVFPGDGFPTAYQTAPMNTCKDFYAGPVASGGGNGNPMDMAAACAALTPPGGKPGSTAEACCELNGIAYNGSGGVTVSRPGPFFAESQADIVLSFGNILASITNPSRRGRSLPSRQRRSRRAPSRRPPARSSSDRSFRTRRSLGPERCSGIVSSVSAASQPRQPNSLVRGDSTAVNLATQGAANRLFITVVGDELSAPNKPPLNLAVDSARTLTSYSRQRPVRLLPTAFRDTRGTSGRGRTGRLSQGAIVSPAADFRLALNVDNNTCKKTKVILTGTTVGARGTTVVPALNLDDGTECANVMWGFETAHASPMLYAGTPASAGTYDFNIRCSGSSAAVGRCSITATPCNVSDPAACTGGTEPVGETCVPQCAAMGAIFNASPTVMGPPDSFLRDSGYRTFQAERRKRRPVVFAATTDGILHALKAVEDSPGANHELWSFVPPGALPLIASNYPSATKSFSMARPSLPTSSGIAAGRYGQRLGLDPGREVAQLTRRRAGSRLRLLQPQRDRC